MVEPTESEPLVELDRFCDAMIAIRGEIAKVERGEWPRDDNPLRQRAAHRARAAEGRVAARLHARGSGLPGRARCARHKYWSPVGRVDNVYGDRNLFCSCLPVSEVAE